MLHLYVLDLFGLHSPIATYMLYVYVLDLFGSHRPLAFIR